VLELIDLHRRYGPVIALDGLSFNVQPGRVVGFLGPNGAGKTTAMRAIFGVVALGSGEVRWHGRAAQAADRRRFGYMPEERGLYPGMRVGEHLIYVARLHGLSAADSGRAAAHWMERLGIGDRSKDKVEALSLGNQQRAQLAAALVHQPELLVLDEPFSGLDPVGTDTMSSVLAERAADGAAVLFSSHQLDLVEHVCEEVAIINRGRLVAAGPVEDLARGERPRLVVRVGGDTEGLWAAGIGRLGTVIANDKGTLTLDLAEGADSQAVLQAALKGGPVEHFGFGRRHLSEVFRTAVGATAGEGPGAFGPPAAQPAAITGMGGP
jgi:ABC-2 type transport system ATP-binding protein